MLASPPAVAITTSTLMAQAVMGLAGLLETTVGQAQRVEEVSGMSLAENFMSLLWFHITLREGKIKNFFFFNLWLSCID